MWSCTIEEVGKKVQNGWISTGEGRTGSRSEVGILQVQQSRGKNGGGGGVTAWEKVFESPFNEDEGREFKSDLGKPCGVTKGCRKAVADMPEGGKQQENFQRGDERRSVNFWGTPGESNWPIRNGASRVREIRRIKIGSFKK